VANFVADLTVDMVGKTLTVMRLLSLDILALIFIFKPVFCFLITGVVTIFPF
jgi:hypothetical protein